MTLRRVLGLSFVLACGVPLLVFWMWPHSRALDAELERSHERHLVLAQAAAETLAVYQKNVEATFRAIVDGVRNGSDLGFASGLLAAQAFSHFCVVESETGRIVTAFSLSGRELPQTLPPDLLAELKRRLDMETPQLSEVWRGEKGGAQFLLVEEIGDRMVFASVNGSFLKRIADSVAFGQRGHLAVLDARGRAIAHPNQDWVNSLKDLSGITGIADLFKTRTPKVLVFFSPALNEDVVAGTAPVGNSGWRVLVPQPVSEVQATVIAGRISASLVFSVGLAISALVAMAAAAIIASPLKGLARAADEMANGSHGIVVGPLPRLAPVELRALRASFNKMARRIESTVARITALARQDPSTGLLNKRAFQEAAEARLDGLGGECGACLVHIDVDNLKRINDIYGHATGDEAISLVARFLQSAFPPPALVARVGGDEFLVLTENMPVKRLETAMQPLLEGKSLHVGQSSQIVTKVTCSTGVACNAGSGSDLNLLSDQADEAMYFAKKSGSRLKFYDDEMRSKARWRFELSSRLRLDVAMERVEASVQPIFCPRSGEVVAFEALARWQTEDFGVIAPDEFLSVARVAGFIGDLDRCVRRKAFAFARDLRDRGNRCPVAVNVTAKDLAQANFIERFVNDLRESGLCCADVIVEVTETVFHDRYGLAIETLTRLSVLGVAIRLDDFGKGFSSHGLLPLCDFEAIKIDMRFAGDPIHDAKAAAIVSSLVHLGSELGLTVVLEGIETEAERKFALSHNVDHVQGHYYGRPMDRAAAIEAFAAKGVAHVAE